MGTLIKFEFKKIFGNRAGMVACAVAFALLVLVVLMNLLTTHVRDYDTGTMMEGTNAQVSLKETEGSHAGPITDERAAADLAVFRESKALADSVEDFDDLSSEQMIEKYGLEFWQQTIGVMNQPYYQSLQNILALEGGAFADSVEEGAQAALEGQLSAGFMGNLPYSDAEKAYWRDKADNLEWPLEYGYAGGWNNAYCWMSYLALAMIAICITVSGVFAGEYQRRTAAVILPTKLGKRSLPVAKAAAAFIFATVYWWVCVAAIVGLNVAICGAEGANLPFRAMDYFMSPYSLTIGQVVAIMALLGYLIAMGMVAVTLLLSAKLRSTMPVAVIPIVVVFLGMLGLFMGPVAKLAALTPMSSLNWAFAQMLSYQLGPVVFDLPAMTALVYGVLLVVCVPLAVRVFKRHQVV